MGKPEKNFYDALKRNNVFPGVHTRIENYADVGTPDVVGIWNGLEYWVETKVSKNKIKPADPMKICRHEQINWHRTWHNNQGLVLVLVKQPSNLYLYRKCFFTPGESLEYLLLGKAAKKSNSYLYSKVTDLIKFSCEQKMSLITHFG